MRRKGVKIRGGGGGGGGHGVGKQAPLLWSLRSVALAQYLLSFAMFSNKYASAT
jgi:hypothetical protein